MAAPRKDSRPPGWTGQGLGPQDSPGTPPCAESRHTARHLPLPARSARAFLQPSSGPTTSGRQSLADRKTRTAADLSLCPSAWFRRCHRGRHPSPSEGKAPSFPPVLRKGSWGKVPGHQKEWMDWSWSSWQLQERAPTGRYLDGPYKNQEKLYLLFQISGQHYLPFCLLPPAPAPLHPTTTTQK